jgi:hypothetical protein
MRPLVADRGNHRLLRPKDRARIVAEPLHFLDDLVDLLARTCWV